jgi:hypothetical protein
MNTYRSRVSEQRVADDFEAGRDLMCSARGCPHRWSVDCGSGRLCSWHGWAAPHLWPQITQERLDALADRAHKAQYKQPAVVRNLSKVEKMQALQGLQDMAAQPKKGTKRDWAHRIVDRHETGEVISPLVLSMARFVSKRRQA